MSLPESEPAIGDELAAELRNVARALDAASPSVDGRSVRSAAPSAGAANVVLMPSKRRRRTLFLSVAAVLIAAIGVVAVLGRNGEERFTVGPATDGADVDADADLEDEPEEAPASTQAPPSTIPEESDEAGPEESVNGFLPIPVAAAEIGPVEARLLPPADSGLNVEAVSQVLTSEMEVSPSVAEPIRVDGASMLSTDPSEKRSISLLISTYATAADAEAGLAEEPTMTGVVSDEPIDVEGRVGAWSEEAGVTAPYSGGDPKYDLGVARALVEPTVVLDIAGADLARVDAEAIIGGAEMSEDGSMRFTVWPDGFDEAVASPGRGPTWLTTAGDAPPIDYIDMSLADESGIPLSVTVVAGRSEMIDTQRATVESDQGHGWVSSGLFRETVVTWVAPETTISLIDYSGSRTGEELLALAQQFRLVGEAEWEERLAGAQAYQAPAWQ